MTTIIYAVGIALGFFVALVFFGAIGYGAYRIYKALQRVADAIDVFNGQVAGIPAILEGVKNICIELSAHTVKLEGAVGGLHQSLFDNQTSDPRRGRDSLREYSDEDAGREYNIKNLMATRQLTYQQARDLTVAGIDEDRFVVGE